MIQARYGNRCPGCGEWIEQGDMIGKVDGAYSCEVCVESAGGDDFDRAQPAAYPMSSTYEPEMWTPSCNACGREWTGDGSLPAKAVPSPSPRRAGKPITRQALQARYGTPADLRDGAT